ncbi:MAG: ketopantoate reductase family protein [Beijerinckiaceae bacterium]
MRIGIVGAGSLGSAIGGALAAGGHDVVLINRNRAHVDAINASGLTLRRNGEDRAVPVRAALPEGPHSPADLVIVLVKSFHTEAAMRAALGLVGADTVVMSLQNGLGHEDILSAIVGAEKVVCGKSYVGGLMLEPGLVVAGIDGKETVIGERDGRITPRITAIGEAFQTAGLPVIVSDNIMGAMWDKLLVNVSTGALSGITRLVYGEMYQMPELEAVAVAAVREGMAAAHALGIAISFTDPREPWLKAGRGLPYEFKASMLQSLEKGSVTEVDFIHGAVVRAGEKTGIATPVNSTLVACIKGIERALPQEAA